MTQQQRVGVAIALAGFGLIAALTLTPQPSGPTLPPSWCVLCPGYGVQDIILNVLLFVPFGIGLRLVGVARWRAIAIAAAVSGVIELLQMHVIAGRDSSLGDVISNSVGGGIGVGVAESWRLWVVPTARQARGLAIAGVVALVATMTATVWGERTALPETTFWGQWTPELLGLDRFPGELVRASVGGFAFPRGVMGSSEDFRRYLVADTMLVNAVVVPGGVTHRLAPIVSVYDSRRTRILLLGQRGRDLVFVLRGNADAVHMRTTGIRLVNAFPEAVQRGDTLRLSGGVVDRQLVARVARGSLAREYRVALGPALGWTQLLPFDYAFGPESALLSSLWIAGLFLVVGYWGARSDRRGGMIALLAGAAVLGLGVIPPIAGGHTGGWWVWCAAAIGAMAGWYIAGGRSPAATRSAALHREAAPGA